MRAKDKRACETFKTAFEAWKQLERDEAAAQTLWGRFTASLTSSTSQQEQLDERRQLLQVYVPEAEVTCAVAKQQASTSLRANDFQQAQEYAQLAQEATDFLKEFSPRKRSLRQQKEQEPKDDSEEEEEKPSPKRARRQKEPIKNKKESLSSSSQDKSSSSSEEDGSSVESKETKDDKPRRSKSIPSSRKKSSKPQRRLSPSFLTSNNKKSQSSPAAEKKKLVRDSSSSSMMICTLAELYRKVDADVADGYQDLFEHLQLVETSPADIAIRAPHHAQTLTPGQVGIRCGYCAAVNNDDDDDDDDDNGSASLDTTCLVIPRSLHNVPDMMYQLKRYHFLGLTSYGKQCPHLPEQIPRLLRETNRQRVLVGVADYMKEYGFDDDHFVNGTGIRWNGPMVN